MLKQILNWIKKFRSVITGNFEAAKLDARKDIILAKAEKKGDLQSIPKINTKEKKLVFVKTKKDDPFYFCYVTEKELFSNSKFKMVYAPLNNNNELKSMEFPFYCFLAMIIDVNYDDERGAISIEGTWINSIEELKDYIRLAVNKINEEYDSKKIIDIKIKWLHEKKYKKKESTRELYKKKIKKIEESNLW